MQVYAGMDPAMPMSAVAAYARRVESLGFDGIHVAETLHDSLAVSLLVAEHTERITIRTALTLAFPRSPMSTAYAAWDLARFSGGRFELGLGTQIKQNIADRFGVPWHEPVPWMRDYVAATRAVFHSFATRERLHHEGPHYRLTRLQPFFNPGPLDDGVRPPTVWLGGVGAAACALAGEVGDGYVSHPTNSHPRYLTEHALPHLRAAGRDVPVVVSTPVLTGRTSDTVDAAREGQRTSIAFLYSTPAYRPTLDLFGWSDLGPRLQQLTRAGDWAALPDVVTDEVLDTLIPSATWADLPGVLHDWYAGVADGISLFPPADAADDADFAAVIRAIRTGG